MSPDFPIIRIQYQVPRFRAQGAGEPHMRGVRWNMYKDKESFLMDIKYTESRVLLDIWFSGTRLPFAFDSGDSLKEFYDVISEDWKNTEKLAIGGTSAWRFSLHPQKDFKEFSESSDIDVINVSEKHFVEIWNRIRAFSCRSLFSLLSSLQRQKEIPIHH